MISHWEEGRKFPAGGEGLGTGERMGLRVGLAASGVTWEVRVAGSLLFGGGQGPQ